MGLHPWFVLVQLRAVHDGVGGLGEERARIVTAAQKFKGLAKLNQNAFLVTR